MIGCMTSLRTLETHPRINTYTGGAMWRACGIVGVQFRNCATAGGSILADLDFLMCSLCFWHWTPMWSCTKAAGFPWKSLQREKSGQGYFCEHHHLKHPQKSVYLSQRIQKQIFPCTGLCGMS